MGKRKRGFTVIEFIFVLAALAVLAAIAVPSLLSVVAKAQVAADGASVKVLNDLTSIYRALHNITSDDAFAGVSDDEARMQVLVDDGLLEAVPVPQQEEAAFVWSKDGQVWLLYVAGEAAPLTSLGSTFADISSEMIRLAQERKATTGFYGRSWGDYAYTDLGLTPGDWAGAVDHIVYKPGGSTLMITPEAGYTFLVEDLSGAAKTLPASYHWNLVYDCDSGVWYYHSIAAGSEINIATLQVVPG